MIRTALLACSLMLCVACSREEPATAPADAGTAATAPAATLPATASPALPTDQDAAFDVGAFSGTFTGDGIRLELHADGSYGMDGPGGISQGTWTHEAANASIRLDPGSKAEDDRLLRMTDRDTLAVDGATLRRQPAP